MSILDPQKYALTITMGDNSLTVGELRQYINKCFGKLYEISIVYDFKRQFSKF